ncbi:xanthine dehydrogenase family protein molybdopterin-binding subunit [Inquilinus sp. CA228]|uniref:xanthine dehydrogenase family protein molybdopterin-binding subunit n=1 Tax=Inquilinus sp. CA228 TaxID=3455609 RepID=UPI003F8D8D43
MVTAAPVPGGRLLSVDSALALAVAGVEQVVRLDDAVAVIARDSWAARQGLAALAPRFSDGGHGGVSSAGIDAAQDRALAEQEGEARVTLGDAAAALAQAGRIVEATYRVPHLHHAAMEPITVTAQLAGGRLTVWAGDHNPLVARRQLVALSGLAEEDVTLVPLPMGGSFGRRGGRDDRPPAYFIQAVALAKAVAPNPVKLVWSREEEFAQGTFRPRLATRIRAALAPDGTPLAWSQLYVDGMPAPVEAFRIPYAIPHQSIRSVAVPDPVRRGSWRGVNHTQHAFWAESFIDELAHAAGRDPFAYRRDLLPPGSRPRRVLEAAAEAAGWGAPLPPGAGRGIAVAEAYGTVVAHVIEASLGPGGKPVVHRVIAAVDCGDVCNPDTARQQVEGAVVMGLSAAIAERITIEAGAVVERNFPDYPLLGLAATPEIEVRFLRSDGPWGGLGEPGLPPVAPALANALFAATQRRCRNLPLSVI